MHDSAPVAEPTPSMREKSKAAKKGNRRSTIFFLTNQMMRAI